MISRTGRRSGPRPQPTTRRRLNGLALTLASVGVLMLVFPLTSASAQDPEKSDGSTTLAINRVDATGGQLKIEGWLTGAAPDELRLKVDGKDVASAAAELNSAAGRSSDVMVVLDNSESLGNGTVQLSKKALDPLLPGAGVVSSMGVISTGRAPTVEQGLTTNAGAIETSLVGIIPDGVSRTWAGVRRAAEMLADRPASSDGSVVLFAASPMDNSEGGMGAATAALRRAGVEFHVVGLGAGADLGALSQVVDDTGGTIRVVPNDEALASATKEVSSLLAGRFTVSTSVTTSGEITPLSLSLGDTTSEVSFVPGAIRTGSTALAPVTASTGGISGLFSSPLVKWLAVLLGVISAVALFWAVLSLVLPDETNLVQRLEVYEDPYGDKPERFELPDEGHATVPIIRKAVELTGDIANKRGLTENLEVKLERANVPLRAAEVLFFAIISAILLTVVAAFFMGSLFMGLIFGAVALIVPMAWLNLRIRRRQRKFVNQLPDMLTLLAGTLRAGYSISQGFESVSTEIEDPMGRELRRVVSEARLGRSLEEALEAVAERMQSDDFAWAVMAIRIQREVGGNLAELLLTVAETMTQRERLRRDVLTLTAEGRMSAIIIGILPPGLGGVMYMMNPEYIKELLTPGLGYMLIGLASVSMCIGFVWMKKTVTIEV